MKIPIGAQILLCCYLVVVVILPLIAIIPQKDHYIFKLDTTNIKPEAIYNKATVKWMKEQNNNATLRLEHTGLGKYYYFYTWGYTIEYQNGTTRTEHIKNYQMDVEELFLSDSQVVMDEKPQNGSNNGTATAPMIRLCRKSEESTSSDECNPKAVSDEVVENAHNTQGVMFAGAMLCCADFVLAVISLTFLKYEFEGCSVASAVIAFVCHFVAALLFWTVSTECTPAPFAALRSFNNGYWEFGISASCPDFGPFGLVMVDSVLMLCPTLLVLMFGSDLLEG